MAPDPEPPAPDSPTPAPAAPERTRHDHHWIVSQGLLFRGPLRRMLSPDPAPPPQPAGAEFPREPTAPAATRAEGPRHGVFASPRG